MRIAIYHNLPSGGAKRALFELVRHLAVNHDLDVYTLASANHDFADIRPYVTGHKVYNFVPAALLSSPWGRLNQAIRLGDLHRLRWLSRRVAADIELGGYDLVFVHGCQYEKAPAILYYIQTSPKVYYCQESLRHLYESMPVRPYAHRTGLRTSFDRLDPLPALYHTTLKYMDRCNLRDASCVLVNSEYSRSEIRRIYGVDAQVSYLGVDTVGFHPSGTERDNFVLSVGSITPLKGFDFLITALGKVPTSQRPKLVIASNFQDPSERTYLSALAAGCMVDLHLMGNVSDEQLSALYNRARMTLYAPIREPFGLVALESMACATPVVAVSEGGVQETIVHGDNGLLTERNASQFAEAVQLLLDDQDMADRLGKNGRTHVVRKWSWEQAATRLENHLTASWLRWKSEAREPALEAR